MRIISTITFIAVLLFAVATAQAQSVGIGVPAPTFKLHVWQPTNAVGGMQIMKDNTEDAINVDVLNAAGGIGNAIDITFNSNTTASSALWMKNYGGFGGLNIDNYGDAMGAQIWNHNATSRKATLTLHHEALGSGFYMDNQATAVDTMVYFIQQGTGLGQYIYSASRGLSVYAGANDGTFTRGNSGFGVYGYTDDALATNRSGVYGRATAFSGVTGSSGAGSTYGVFSFGDFGGTGAKYFVIDHPTDPANKMLKHFCIESDEPVLIYRGKVTLDASGRAEVQLKDYVAAINKDYTYNLTPIGSFQPVFIEQEVGENGRFAIAGGSPGAQIAWTVYGERNDAYFQAHPEKLEVEIAKPASMQGKYLDPASVGQPASAGVDFQEGDNGSVNRMAPPKPSIQRPYKEGASAQPRNEERPEMPQK